MATAEIQISSMQLQDIPDVLQIERASYPFPWSEQIIRDCLKVGYHGLVLRDTGTLCAYAFASGAAGEAHILNICVDPGHRGRGYAKALLHQSIATVMVNGAKVIFLEVRESNKGAINLYESLGFVEIGRREDYYRVQPAAGRGKPGAKSSRQSANRTHEDALVMSRDLTTIADDSDI